LRPGCESCDDLDRRRQLARRHYNSRVIIESSAPTRIDLAGGTLDIWPLYLFHPGAQTINCAISLRARCTLAPRADTRLAIHSKDSGQTVDVGHWSELRHSSELTLLGRILHHFEASGVELTTSSDSPMGAGIAGSSALNVAVCGAMARWRALDLNDSDLLQIAMNVEAQAIEVPTGVQDYRPAVYGGISAVELRVDGVHRAALDVDPRQLASRLVLAYTGASRNSGINNWDVFRRHIDGDRRVFDAFEQIRDAAAALREALQRSDWPEVGRQIAREWETRKQLAPGVTTPTIESLMDAARRAGAAAAKVCGAGGGGCLFCYTDPADRDAVGAALRAAGARVLDFQIDEKGLEVAARAAAPA
jgi:D-glycero-alpha-D-manno-heptose-7-phosphate kinase